MRPTGGIMVMVLQSREEGLGGIGRKHVRSSLWILI